MSRSATALRVVRGILDAAAGPLTVAELHARAVGFGHPTLTEMDVTIAVYRLERKGYARKRVKLVKGL